MLFPFSAIRGWGHVNEVGYESKEKNGTFRYFPKREIQKSVPLCPLPVILCEYERKWSWGQRRSHKCPLPLLFCEYVNEGGYKGKDAAASVLCL